MDRVTAIKNYYRVEEWKQLLFDFQSSGMKLYEWCESRNVTKDMYYYWLRKIREQACDELEYIPTKVKIIRYMQQACECPEYKHNRKPFIKKAFTPTSVLNHSLASPSSVARVMYQKYVNSIPLYRQEKDCEQVGIGLSRATMANWIIRSSEDYLIPVVNHLQSELLKRDIIHCDETPVQVLKEDGKEPQTKSYMWLYRSGNDGKSHIVLYDY